MKPAYILLMLLLAGLLSACDPFVSPPDGYATGDDPGLAFLRLRLDSTIKPAWPNGAVLFGDTILQYGLPVDGYPWCFRDFRDFTNGNVTPELLPRFWPGPASPKPLFRYNNPGRREAIMLMEDDRGNAQGYLYVDFTHINQPRRKACFRLSLANFSPWILGCFNGYLLARKEYHQPAPDTIFIYNLNLLSPQDTSFQDLSGKHTAIIVQDDSNWTMPLLRGRYLYTSGHHSGSPLCAYDFSDPEHPVLVWKVEDVAAPYLLEAGNTLLGYGAYDGIRAFDASDPARLLPGMGMDIGNLYAVGVRDSILYTLSGNAPFLDVYSIRNPARWKHLRRIRMGDGGNLPNLVSTFEMRFYGDTLVCGGLCFTGNTY